MRFKPFSFLKDNNLLVTIKTKLLEALRGKKDDVKQHVYCFIKNKSPEAEKEITDFLIANIKLPFYLKPFKGIVRKNILKNLDKICDFIFSYKR